MNLSQICWRLKDAAVFRSVVSTLRSRLVYNDAVWAYGLLHNDRDTIAEYAAAHAHELRFTVSGLLLLYGCGGYACSGDCDCVWVFSIAIDVVVIVVMCCVVPCSTRRSSRRCCV